MSSVQKHGPKKGDIGPIPFSSKIDQLESLKSILAPYINSVEYHRLIYGSNPMYCFKSVDNSSCSITIYNGKYNNHGVYTPCGVYSYIQINNLPKNTVVASVELSVRGHGSLLNTGRYIHDINNLPATVESMISTINEKNQKNTIIQCQQN